MASHVLQVKKLKHHDQQEICKSRPKYRQGRKSTAVKVYTVNQESKYLLIQGVPMVGAKDELENLCSEYGPLTEINALDDYPTEEFTEAYCVKYQMLRNAKFAKKKLDERSFFGGCLHVCYAPEFETLNDTREKMQERRKFIAFKTHDPTFREDNWSTSSHDNSKRNQLKPDTISVQEPSNEPITYIWAGKTYIAENPSTTLQTNTNQKASQDEQNVTNTRQFVPRQLKRPITNSNATSDSIRAKLNSVKAPVLDVSLKRKRLVQM